MPTHIEGAAMMAPVCYTRIFLILRLKQVKAYELFDLGDDNARKDGLAVLRMMVDQRNISTWVRLKGCVALSFHVSNLEEAAVGSILCLWRNTLNTLTDVLARRAPLVRSSPVPVGGGPLRPAPGCSAACHRCRDCAVAHAHCPPVHRREGRRRSSRIRRGLKGLR